MRHTDSQDPLLPDPNKSFIAKVIEWSVNNQLLVMLGLVALLFFGLLSLRQTPLDAIPDLTDTQIIIRTDFPGQSPQLVEDLVTYPLSSAMLGLPKTKDVRGFSMFGTSFVYIIFEDDVDLYWARSRVLESLSSIQDSLPPTAKAKMGPDATGVGWVYQYAVIDDSGELDLSDLRSLQDWFIKYELAAVEGVAEVASVGGFVKEYQVLIDPNRLRAYDVPINRIKEAVQAASVDVGGRVIEQGESELMIRSKGYITDLQELRDVVVKADKGTPVLLSDIARVIEGPALRRGVVDFNGEGEVVSGIIVMRDGENALQVIQRVKHKIEAISSGLPPGVRIVPVYDRAPLIEGAVAYLTRKLIEEGFVVALVSLIFLLHVRAAFVAIITLPLGVLAAFIIMQAQGITANIMSLGGIAIAIGAMVDASIVMVENAHRKLSTVDPSVLKTQRHRIILDAAKEVGPGLFFSLLIITVSFLPVFALNGQSLRLFSPLAFTKTYAMASAAILSVTLVPVLMLWLLRGKIRREMDNPINRLFVRFYTPVLRSALKFKWATLFITSLLFISLLLPFTRLGSEFMPDLYEGELLYMPTTLPGISITEAKQVLAQTNRMIKSVEEVEQVFGKVGRADSATDPAPISMIESWITLKPKSQWRPGLTLEQLIRELNQTTDLPGLVNSWGFPIKIRMDMISTGIRTPLGIKITGSDLSEINRIALELESIVNNVEGTRSVFADRVLGGRYLEISPHRSALARYNIDLGQFQQVVQIALGGMPLAESVQGRERYDIMLRYQRPLREQIDDLDNILVPTREGQHIPLGELATIEYTEGPSMIRSENARLSGWVFVDVGERDIGSYVEEAKQTLADSMQLPSGYSLEWSGQYQQLQEAKVRMQIAIPATIIIIFVLLMLHFQRLDRTLIVMFSLPFALIGGVWAMYFANYDFSVAVGVGFIALGGIAVETAVVMLLFIDQQMRESVPASKPQLLDAVMRGAALRVRPKLMTVATIVAGLLPIFLTDGLGADVMRRIALPMLGGMFSTLLLTLIVIPVIYYLWESRRFTQ